MGDTYKNFPIPKELKHPFFLKGGSDTDRKENSSFAENFMYEVFFYNGMEARKPWLDSNEAIVPLLEKWPMIKEELQALHHDRRQKEVLAWMEKGIGLFLQFLFWSNDQPVQLMESIPYDQLTIKPVNLRERLEFIMLQPKLHHSFIQLSELFEEQKKHFGKKNSMKKYQK